MLARLGKAATVEFLRSLYAVDVEGDITGILIDTFSRRGFYKT